MAIRIIEHSLSNKDIINKTALCTKDGIVKIVCHKGKYWHCYIAARERLKLWKRRKRQIKKNMLGLFCEICGTSEKLCWDHKHGSNESNVWNSIKYDPKDFRGTLCNRCNMVLGLFHDDPELLLKAHKYLISH